MIDIVEIEIILDGKFGGRIDTDRECFDHIEVVDEATYHIVI